MCWGFRLQHISISGGYNSTHSRTSDWKPPSPAGSACVGWRHVWGPNGDPMETYQPCQATKSVRECVCVCTCAHTHAQSCPTLCDPKVVSPPGFSVHGIFQARILEWMAIFSFRASSQSRDQTHVSCVSCRFFTTKVTKWGAQNQQAPGFEEPPGRRSGGQMCTLFTPRDPWIPGSFS